MDFIGYVKDIKLNNKEVNINLSTYNQTILEKLENLKQKNKELNISIKSKSQKRSLDSNALCWHLCEEIAKVLNTDKDIIYLDMLGKYGVFTHIIVKPEVVERMKEEWRLIKELGEVQINGKSGIQLQCYFGSSTYTQSEMTRFLKGIINECHDLNIPTPEDNELESMIQQWGI